LKPEDCFEFETTETYGRIISANYIDDNKVLIGTVKGYLIKVSIKNDNTFIKEYSNGK